MSEKRFEVDVDHLLLVWDTRKNQRLEIEDIVGVLNEQQSTIDKQEMRLQRLEELLELSENLNKSYREKLIDMNLKMVIGNE